MTWADASTVVAQWANRVQNVVQTSWYDAASSWTPTLVSDASSELLQTPGRR